MDDVIAGDETGLRDIARWLTTPAASGVYLSSRDLQRIGDSAGLGRLPQNRQFAVEQLFRSAAIDNRLPDLFAALMDEMSDHITSYQDCDSASLQVWTELAGQTLMRLRQMQADSTG